MRIALVLAAAIATLVACGGADESGDTSDGDASTAPAPTGDPPSASSSSGAPAPSADDDAGSDGSAPSDGGAEAGPKYPVPPATHVVTAEQASAKVIVFDFAVTDWSKPNAVVWTWSPPSPTSTFSNLSDVKYTKDGKRLLVAASGGGIAVVDIATKKVLFDETPGGNTHAIEELPNGNIVSASSTGGFLKLYSKAGTLLQTVPFEDAHGVYWDAARNRLWADGGTTLKAFTYSGTALAAAGSWTLPSGATGAHDLFPVPYGNDLFLSASAKVFLFDRTKLAFHDYTSGPVRGGIKAVSQNPGSPAVCLMKATNAPGPQPRSWSSDTLIFDQPGSTPSTVTRVRPGAQFYKARWAAATP